ncbi:MAG TPA: SPOR domain-containing protein [Arcobacter sp.]|nr:SPOR domain-containing protein [Arcobacter sp.]
MEFRGDEFIKNLEIEKEKVRLQEQTDSLNAQKQQTLFKSSNENIKDLKIDTNEEDTFTQLDDIVLENNNNNNKQKYIIFGFALVLLFLITIITIRLVQEPKTQEDFTNDTTIEEVAPKKIFETKKSVNNSLDIDKIVQAEEDIKTIEVQKPVSNKKESASDIFGIENKATEKTIVKEEAVKVKKILKIEEPKIVKKTTPVKKTTTILEKKEIKEINLKEKFSNKKQMTAPTKGYFIQVGAFTKAIDKKLLKTLNKSKYNYIQHKMTINGRIYNKVLVGSYKNSSEAKKELNAVRKLIHNSKAYIMRLK